MKGFAVVPVRPAVIALCAFVLQAACAAVASGESEAEALPPSAKWDFKPQGETWTDATMSILGAEGARLPQTVPRDIANWCPAYPEADEAQRAAFWNGLISALAEHESTWNPRAVGGGGRWFGLVQISPATARGYGCEARSGEALKSGTANLSCALRIWSVTVPRDGVVSAGGGGVAADWGPMVQSRKREAMRAWIREQEYCQAG